MIARVLDGGARALGSAWRIGAAIAAFQLALAASSGLLVALVLDVRAGDRPWLGRALDGDLPSLITLATEPGVGAGLALAVGAPLVVALVASWWIGAGLLGHLGGVPFRTAAARGLAPFARLWLLALVPYTFAIAGLLLAARAGLPRAFEAVDARGLVGPLAALVPGLLALLVVAGAVDYARIRVAAGERRAVHALGVGFRTVLARPFALAHLAVYAVAWILLALGVACVAGLVATLVLRQVAALGRLALRIVVTGGQLVLVREVTP